MTVIYNLYIGYTSYTPIKQLLFSHLNWIHLTKSRKICVTLCSQKNIFFDKGARKEKQKVCSRYWTIGAGWWFQPTPLNNDGLRQMG